MAKLTNDADYDASETFENVSSPLSDAGNHDNYYGRRLRTRCVLHGPPENKTKLRQRGQPTSINRKETATTPEATTSWSSYIEKKENELIRLERILSIISAPASGLNPSQLCEIICDKEFLRSLITPDSSSAPSKAESAFIREGGTESFQQGVDLACQSETGMLSNSESDHKWQSSLVTSNDYQECVTGVTFGNREEPSKVSLTAKEEAVLYGEKDLEQDSPHSDEHAAMGNADRVHNTDQIYGSFRRYRCNLMATSLSSLRTRSFESSQGIYNISLPRSTILDHRKANKRVIFANCLKAQSNINRECLAAKRYQEGPYNKRGLEENVWWKKIRRKRSWSTKVVVKRGGSEICALGRRREHSTFNKSHRPSRSNACSKQSLQLFNPYLQCCQPNGLFVLHWVSGLSSDFESYDSPISSRRGTRRDTNVIVASQRLDVTQTSAESLPPTQLKEKQTRLQYSVRWAGTSISKQDRLRALLIRWREHLSEHRRPGRKETVARTEYINNSLLDISSNNSKSSRNNNCSSFKGEETKSIKMVGQHRYELKSSRPNADSAEFSPVFFKGVQCGCSPSDQYANYPSTLSGNKEKVPKSILRNTTVKNDNPSYSVINKETCPKLLSFPSSSSLFSDNFPLDFPGPSPVLSSQRSHIYTIQKVSRKAEASPLLNVKKSGKSESTNCGAPVQEANHYLMVDEEIDKNSSCLNLHLDSSISLEPLEMCIDAPIVDIDLS